jgi:hypothetical protein
MYYNLEILILKTNNRHFYGLFNLIFWWNNNYWPTPLEILCKNKTEYNLLIDILIKLKNWYN